jgi:hypothetical protein
VVWSVKRIEIKSNGKIKSFIYYTIFNETRKHVEMSKYFSIFEKGKFKMDKQFGSSVILALAYCYILAINLAVYFIPFFKFFFKRLFYFLTTHC